MSLVISKVTLRVASYTIIGVPYGKNCILIINSLSLWIFLVSFPGSCVVTFPPLVLMIVAVGRPAQNELVIGTTTVLATSAAPVYLTARLHSFLCIGQSSVWWALLQ